MRNFQKILTVLEIRRSRLEADIGRLTAYMSEVDREIERLHAEMARQEARLKAHMTEAESIQDAMALNRWRTVTRQTITALTSKREEAQAKSEPLKEALKTLLVKSELIETQMTQQQRADYETYIEEQSSARLETWVTTNRI